MGERNWTKCKWGLSAIYGHLSSVLKSAITIASFYPLDTNPARFFMSCERPSVRVTAVHICQNYERTAGYSEVEICITPLALFHPHTCPSCTYRLLTRNGMTLKKKERRPNFITICLGERQTLYLESGLFKLCNC